MKDTKVTVDTGTFIRFWLVILGFAGVIGFVWLAQGPLVIVAISFFLALVLNRPVSWLARHLPGKSRAFATLVAYLMILAIIILVFFNVVPVFVKQLANFLGDFPHIVESLQKNTLWLGDFLAKYNLTNQYHDWLNGLQKEAASAAGAIGGSFVGLLNGLVGATVNSIFVAVLTFLMLIEGPAWEEKYWRLAYTDDKKRKRHQAVARKISNVVTGYMSGQITVALISATLTAIAVVILSLIFGFELSLAWPAWTIIFVMTFLPMFGAIIGGGVVTLLLLIYSWPAALIYLAYFIVEQQIENNLIAPHIQSKKLNLSALVILIAILLGLNVGGLLGALVAIPVAGSLVVLAKEAFHARRRRKAQADSVVLELDIDDGAAPVFDVGRDFIKIRLPKFLRREK